MTAPTAAPYDSSAMPKLGAFGAATLRLVVTAAALVCGAAPAEARTVLEQSAPAVLVAVDADTSGNDSRTVGTVEDCVSTDMGEPVDVDIVIASPGVPADRGIAAFQFSIMYDPAVVWIGADDGAMLLAQADGSNVIPIGDPKPDRNGVYQSWAIDFGTPGIEPVGASETGPGVIARITLLPQSDGVSPLTLSNVLLIDDSSERLSLELLGSASIHVGQPCPDESENGTPTPTPTATPTPEPTPTAAPTTTPSSTPASGPGLDAPRPAGGAATGVGSLAPTASGLPIWAIFMSTLGGAGLLIACRLALRGRPRNPTLASRGRAPRSPNRDAGEP